MNSKVFIIDTGRCIGCHACSVSCKDRAGLPDNYDLLRVERMESGSYPKVEMYYRVSHCFHCERPTCLEACKFDAISKNEDGYLKLDQVKCTRCGACIDACPFDAIVELPGKTVRKCDGCNDEVSKGGDPICVRACLTRALSYSKVDENFVYEGTDEEIRNHRNAPAVIYVKKKTNL